MKKYYLIISSIVLIIILTGCGKIYIPQNPYKDDTGHYAGYEWAKKNFDNWVSEYTETGKVCLCSGNSESFIEGCEEYLKQKEKENLGSATFQSGF